jgi:hypothetical protein
MVGSGRLSGRRRVVRRSPPGPRGQAGQQQGQALALVVVLQVDAGPFGLHAAQQRALRLQAAFVGVGPRLQVLGHRLEAQCRPFVGQHHLLRLQLRNAHLDGVDGLLGGFQCALARLIMGGQRRVAGQQQPVVAHLLHAGRLGPGLGGALGVLLGLLLGESSGIFLRTVPSLPSTFCSWLRHSGMGRSELRRRPLASTQE